MWGVWEAVLYYLTFYKLDIVLGRKIASVDQRPINHGTIF